jgi:hypothetical protein
LAGIEYDARVGETEEPRDRPATPARTLVRSQDPTTDAQGEVDLKAVATWVLKHRVILAGLAMIVAQFAWRAIFLSNMYFRQDDFYNLDLAIKSPLNWHYLTFNTAGNVVVGTQLITWVLARVSLYDWGLASAVILVLLACADLAALRLMRTLFGNRPMILIPLAVYLLIPITLPGFGWWSAALESLPLQLAIFMTLNAHVRYLRTGLARHLVIAAAWLCFGLACFEKALILPVLLFGVTAAYFCDGPSLLAGAKQALVRFRRAWVVYAIIEVAGAVFVVISLRTSTIHPHAPSSLGAVLTYSGALLRDTLIPGMLGGPWWWLPLGDGSYALASPPALLAWLAIITVAVIFGASVLRRKIAWRSWAMLAVWVAAADIVPVAIGRLNYLPALTFGMETRYVADAAPVIAICLGLAFWPLAERRTRPEPAKRSLAELYADYRWRAAAAVFGAFVVGSLWSNQIYAHDTSGHLAATYVANAKQAVQLAPRGSLVLDWPVPSGVESGLFGRYHYASTLIGDLEQGKLAGNLRWLRSHPVGTLDKLLIFGNDGRLYPAMIFGMSSVPRTATQGCWPNSHGRVVVRFASRTSTLAWELRVGYIWGSRTPGTIIVRYGHTLRLLEVRHGLHSAYLPVKGSAARVVVSGFGSNPICIGDAQAGSIGPDPFGPIIPPKP